MPADVEAIKIDGCLVVTDDVDMTESAYDMLTVVRAAVGIPDDTIPVELTDGGSLPSVFAVSDLAQASVAAAGVSLASLMALDSGTKHPEVTVDRELASAWFQSSLRPQGWELPPPWNAVAGDYATGDGWIRLHTNAAHHRAAAMAVLDVPEDRTNVATAARSWAAEELEAQVVGAGGAAAVMRPLGEWRGHPQGRAVAGEPLLRVERTSTTERRGSFGRDDRPLDGLRVLDLTRILAGPVATRLLAGWGAEVLRIDPPDWDEPAIAPEVTLGKHCARLDLRAPEGRNRFLELLRTADVLVHGYRSDALDGLGLGHRTREEVRPGLVDVSLDAYGWTGPWAGRRGFDSLVQMSTGIAEAGRVAAGVDHPVSLPAQALDHATGYLLAAAVIAGVALRQTDAVGSRWRASLARTADLLIGAGTSGADTGGRPSPPAPTGPVERTSWGDALRLRPPLTVTGAPLQWSLPARALGSDEACWPE
jgi:crotonobetainyl-CoA:carnitine CoA-transferase CaiB-like acyl-CoA transferase